MSRVAFSRKRVKLWKFLGVRLRLALLLVAPLMLERVRTLEEARTRQLVQVTQEFRDLAERTAGTQRGVIASVATVSKSTAYIRAAGGIARSCDLMRSSLPLNLPGSWNRSLACRF